jgi:hypothetical protein
MAGGSCIAIQQPRQLNGIAQGVHLVFAFPQPLSNSFFSHAFFNS